MRRVHRSGATWAFLAAVGAGYLVTGVALILRELVLPSARALETAITNNTLYFGGLAEPFLITLALSCGTFAAGAVARRAGGTGAVALYVGLVVLTGLLLVAHAFEAERRVRSDPNFYIVTLYDMPLTAAATLVLPALALALGALLARSRAVMDGHNAVLEASGAYAIVGVLAVLARFPDWPHVLLAAYNTIGLEDLHSIIVAAQIVAASLIFALRRRSASVSRAAGAFALMGFAGVAYADFAELYGVLFYHHIYVPVSLVVVPLASAGVGVLLVQLLRSQFRSRVALP